MGREIRRVAPDWEHPRNEHGYYQPLFDETFEEACARWLAGLDAFRLENPTGFNVNGYSFWEWDSEPPTDRDYYRLAWKDEPTAYQVYENVSEGTPVSPVFATVDDLRAWLMEEWALSPEAADNFIKTGYSFSMIMINGRITKPGAETIEMMAKIDSNDE